jgi:putative holliday junction resolvase
MILGVDPGTRRIGLAIADEETRFARPLEVVDSSSSDPVARVRAVVEKEEVSLVVVGKPIGLSGREGAAVEAARSLVGDLRAALTVPVIEHDERLSTVAAERALRESGRKGQSARQVVDAVAAQIMLQGYLDSLPARPERGPQA